MKVGFVETPVSVGNNPVLYDRMLFLTLMFLLALGLLMVTSTSMVISERHYHDAFHYVVRQALFLGVSVLAISIILRIPCRAFIRYRFYWLLGSYILLLLVLIPGIGHVVNGSRRWLHLGFLHFQVSEGVKLAAIFYLAGYIDRSWVELQNTWTGFIKPMILLSGLGVLILAEPDFGALVVLMGTAIGMLFLAGVRWRVFLLLLLVVGFVLGGLAFLAPYRLARLSSFLNPWANQFSSGYQLTQSLIAFGRGGFFGLGLGESIQKLFYLPEAHTDFIFAVLAEELGLFGSGLVILAFSILLYRIFKIGGMAIQCEKIAEGFICYGIGLWLMLQTSINIGVNIGLLPTKGLTLPLMSYGGTSLLISCCAVGIVLAIDHELRLERMGIRS